MLCVFKRKADTICTATDSDVQDCNAKRYITRNVDFPIHGVTRSGNARVDRHKTTKQSIRNVTNDHGKTRCGATSRVPLANGSHAVEGTRSLTDKWPLLMPLGSARVVPRELG